MPWPRPSRMCWVAPRDASHRPDPLTAAPPWAEPCAGPGPRAHAGDMAEDTRPPQFGAEARRELLQHRVLVLDGPLDDDNGTLLITQLLALAADDDASDIALWIHSPGGSVP